MEEVSKTSLAEVKKCTEQVVRIKEELKKVIVGQEEIIDGLVMAILCDCHILIEGVPGVAKTLTIKSLAEVSGCQAKRIQFTVDLLPTDIVGITSYDPKKGFEVVKGPVFANFVIADEINRSPPKTQSALLEAMQEKQVTIGKETYQLPRPFFVMASQNPLETSGVYPLPEAQVDRFLFKLLMKYPNIDEECQVMRNNATLKKFEDFSLIPIITQEDIIAMQRITKNVYTDDKVAYYIASIVDLTRTKDFEYGKYIELGASPRASIGLFIASKARALIQGRNFVTPKDVKDIAPHVLRHRLILSYRAKAEGLTTDKVIESILNKVKVP